MAQIEFKNLETLEAFKPILQELETEKQKDYERTLKIKRGLYLIKNAHYWGGIE